MNEAPEQEFICTFGINHPLGRCYVVVKAESPDGARRKMSNVYGSRWAFVYCSRDAAGVERFHLDKVPFGTPNEEEP